MKILFLASWYPFPPDNGSRLRAYHLVRGLARAHDVTLIGLHDTDQAPQNRDEMHEWCRQVIALPRRQYFPSNAKALAALFSPRPRYLVDTFDRGIQNLIDREFSNGKFDAVVASELSMAAYASTLPHRAKVFDEVQVGIFQDAFVNAQGLARGRNALTWYKFARYLRGLASQFAALTVVSEREQARLAVVGIDPKQVYLVPNGVDCETAGYAGQDPEPFTLIYNGAITFYANLDAVRYFVNEILPRVRAVEPRVRLKITGRADQVAQNELSEDNVVLFTGYLDDVRTVVRASSVCVVPLRLGGGTRLKILEAMALGVPVVSTFKGAEGLGLQDRVHLLLAETPQAFADAILGLLSDSELRERLTFAARKHVCQEFDWSKIQERLARVLESVTA